MSRFFPHTEYEEDQPLSHTILTAHVLSRAVALGPVVGASSYGVQDIIRRIRKSPPKPRSLLRQMGVSTLWTLGFLSIGLVGRMWGREEIEWQERSWRLLENKSQLEADDWMYGGMGAGLAASLLMRSPQGLVGTVGSIGTGGLAGALGMMGWRYGVNRGKYPDDKGKSDATTAKG